MLRGFRYAVSELGVWDCKNQAPPEPDDNFNVT